MSLTTIATALNTAEAQALHWRMSLDAWRTDQDIRAAKVLLFREYADGDHRADMTAEMRKMLRISDSSAQRFNDNYMDIVIQTMIDRLRVRALEADTEGANDWIEALLKANRFDGLQNDVHEAAVRDGDTYVMLSWDNDAKRVVISHEPAFDGANGMMVIAAPDNSVQAAIKVWQESENSIGDTLRVNVYYADRIEKYVGRSGGRLVPYEVEGEVWPAPFTWNGQPIGVPVVHIPNRGTSHDFYGLSEIENAIPLQDALNRTLYSMVMTAELTGFGVRWAKGFTPPDGIMPGAWITIAGGGLDKDQVAELGILEQGAITPYIQQAQWLTAEIGKITRTPAPEFMGADTASGESLKQREVGLLGKVRKFQTKAGNRWEDVIRLAWRVEAAYGSQPPKFETLDTRWDEAELRNDTEVITNAKTLIEMGLIKEALRQMSGVFDWDAAKIDELYDEFQQERAGALSALIGNTNLPTFDSALNNVQL